MGGVRQQATLVSISDQHNLALLVMENTIGLESFSPVYATPNNGEPVVAIGKSFGSSKTWVSRGMITKQGSDIHISSEIDPVHSGGPLMTSDGSVVGMNLYESVAGVTFGSNMVIGAQTILDEFSYYIEPKVAIAFRH